MRKLPRRLTEKELLDNIVSVSERNFSADIVGTEYLCRYLGRATKKTLGYPVVSRKSAIVLCYEYADDTPLSRAYALLEPRNNKHHRLAQLHMQK